MKFFLLFALGIFAALFSSAFCQIQRKHIEKIKEAAAKCFRRFIMILHPTMITTITVISVAMAVEMVEGEEAIERSSNGIGGPLQHFGSTMQPFFKIR
jgi:cellobiose-specific phosphotransferase system component IIC